MHDLAILWKGVAANVFNVKEHHLFDQTWVIEVHGLHPNWERVVQLLPTRQQVVDLVSSNAQARGQLCAMLCHKVHRRLGASAQAHIPCSQTFDHGLFTSLL